MWQEKAEGSGNCPFFFLTNKYVVSEGRSWSSHAMWGVALSFSYQCDFGVQLGTLFHGHVQATEQLYIQFFKQRGKKQQ